MFILFEFVIILRILREPTWKIKPLKHLIGSPGTIWEDKNDVLAFTRLNFISKFYRYVWSECACTKKTLRTSRVFAHWPDSHLPLQLFFNLHI